MSAAGIAFRRVTLGAFRNFLDASFEPCRRLNVIAADNGLGKTSLLEALYVVATTRSFRAESTTALVMHGSERAVVRADIEEGDRGREQRVELRAGARLAWLDGKRPRRVADYAAKSPVVAFHPGDLELVAGAAAARRRLLDRVALFVDTTGYEARAPFERALRARQRVLWEAGPHARELDAYETVLSEHGARYQQARGRSAAALLERLAPAFERLAPAGIALEARYVAGGSDDQQRFLDETRARRERDRVRRSATFGPQRDEIELDLDGRPSRSHASQGQQRLLTLALKLAELECIQEARGARPVLCLDDVSSELDPGRTSAVYRALEASAGQVFVTTTRLELFPRTLSPGEERIDFTIEKGSVRRL